MQLRDVIERLRQASSYGLFKHTVSSQGEK
jgi:hypothetical protein